MRVSSFVYDGEVKALLIVFCSVLCQDGGRHSLLYLSLEVLSVNSNFLDSTAFLTPTYVY